MRRADDLRVLGVNFIAPGQQKAKAMDAPLILWMLGRP
jgi:hypothetical protein